jgi:hypothetical protein
MPRRADELTLKQQILDAVPDELKDRVAANLADLDRVRGVFAVDVSKVDHATFMIPIEEIIVALGLNRKYLPYLGWVNPEDGSLYVTCREVANAPNPLPVEVGSGRILVAADVPPEKLTELGENIIQFLYSKDIKGYVGIYAQDEKAMVILKQE